MLVSDAVTNQFEAELDHGDSQTPGLPSRSHDQVLESHPDPVYLEQFSAEPNLGAARGVLWALIFEAALVIAAAAVYLAFHLSR
jgi:hypothetical protein